jgi:dTMP kinase
LATEGLVPDLVIILDVPDEVAARRRAAGDRIEREPDAFHAAVREAYRQLAPSRGWIVLDGSPDLDAVEEAVWTVIRTRLKP